jgi:hypothetical protein
LHRKVRLDITTLSDTYQLSSALIISVNEWKILLQLWLSFLSFLFAFDYCTDWLLFLFVYCVVIHETVDHFHRSARYLLTTIVVILINRRFIVLPQNTIMFIRVADEYKQHNEVVEIPLDDDIDGSVSLSTLDAQFQGVSALKYRHSETSVWRG